MGNRTALYPNHLALGARMTEFSGWELPLHYGSQIAEHHSVRRSAGMFDTSHLNIVDVTGLHAWEFLRRLLANDVARITRAGSMLYTCMLNESGGVIDDLMVCALDHQRFRLALNAGTRERDLAWLVRQASGFTVAIAPRDDLAMISLQGPESPAILEKSFAPGISSLPPFNARWQGEVLISRTGYTGEDGFEILLSGADAKECWQKFLDADVKPCGLGARDTLRLEAGMRLYGADMDESVTPLECGLEWTVAWEPAARDFIGRQALERRKSEGPCARFVGLVLEEQGVLRSHQRVVVDGTGEGIITSGGFSPTLNRSIALARVPPATGSNCRVEIRGFLKRAAVVKPCFVRRGKVQVTL